MSEYESELLKKVNAQYKDKSEASARDEAIINVKTGMSLAERCASVAFFSLLSLGPIFPPNEHRPFQDVFDWCLKAVSFYFFVTFILSVSLYNRLLCFWYRIYDRNCAISMRY